MKNVFKTKLSTASLVLIPACIGINYLGKLFASVLKLPLWLDSIGTCIGGALGGPIIGAICGAANNLIYGFTTGDSITLVYALTSLGIGLAVGIMARLGNMEKISGALITSVIAGLVAVCISTPLNVIFWGGTTGNVWGDAVFAATQASNMPVLLGSFLDEVVVDVPDKIITILVVYAILKGLPKKLTALYDVNEGILYAVRISLNVLNMLLAILHDMDFVAENFERVIVMAHGQALADGTREEVFAQEEVLKKARIEQPYMTRLCSLLGYEKLYFGGI